MQIFIFIILGFSGGILGAMGMGGGTILIPLLTSFTFFSQKEAAFANLIVFVPVAVVALIIHKKNKLLKFNKTIFFVILISFAFAGLGSFLASKFDNDSLKLAFGIFLVLISVFQFYTLIKNIIKKNRLKYII